MLLAPLLVLARLGVEAKPKVPAELYYCEPLYPPFLSYLDAETPNPSALELSAGRGVGERDAIEVRFTAVNPS